MHSILSGRQPHICLLQLPGGSKPILHFFSLQEACQSAGVPAVSLSRSELMSRYRQLSLPADSSGLMQPGGAVLNVGVITAAVRTLADRAGVISRVRDKGNVPLRAAACSFVCCQLLHDLYLWMVQGGWQSHLAECAVV